jgi:putative peptidoglycan binding protein
MVKFKQLILPGDVGSDVLAVKHALKRMGIGGSGAMNPSRRAGPAFVKALEVAQRQHGLLVDGKYGKDSHGVIAPHFTAADAALYERAAIRTPEQPPALSGDAVAPAKRLLELRAQGRYRAEGAGDLADVEATAAGRAVRSALGRFVHIDARVMRVLVHLIESGHTIGTSAICSDHGNDGEHGHAGGFAVDISSIDGHSVGVSSTRALVLAIDRALHQAGPLLPRQLITGGVGNAPDEEISGLTIPNAAFYGPTTMREHCNHIHVGY